MKSSSSTTDAHARRRYVEMLTGGTHGHDRVRRVAA
jgi:hypothetical protein